MAGDAMQLWDESPLGGSKYRLPLTLIGYIVYRPESDDIAARRAWDWHHRTRRGRRAWEDGEVERPDTWQSSDSSSHGEVQPSCCSLSSAGWNLPPTDARALCVTPVYMIKQTSSNHRANIQQMHSKYTCTTCALTAPCLLDVCLMIDWLCKRGINVFSKSQLFCRADVDHTTVDVSGYSAG